ncbi:hypothetical protein Tco_0496268 [Tanacetum coccineum]
MGSSFTSRSTSLAATDPSHVDALLSKITKEFNMEDHRRREQAKLERQKLAQAKKFEEQRLAQKNKELELEE